MDLNRLKSQGLGLPDDSRGPSLERNVERPRRQHRALWNKGTPLPNPRSPLASLSATKVYPSVIKVPLRRRGRTADLPSCQLPHSAAVLVTDLLGTEGLRGQQEKADWARPDAGHTLHFFPRPQIFPRFEIVFPCS